MFKWYERESGQKVEQDVIDRLFYETQGQPGLVSWFGELLTEGYQFHKPDYSLPITPENFDTVYQHAVNALPNNNILNIINCTEDDYSVGLDDLLDFLGYKNKQVYKQLRLEF